MISANPPTDVTAIPVFVVYSETSIVILSKVPLVFIPTTGKNLNP